MSHTERLSSRAGQRGFSYLWVLMSIVLIGFGLVAAAEVTSTAVQRDREKELLAIGRQFQTAIGRYHEARIVTGRGEYPPDLESLLKDNRTPGVTRHLRKVFVDPMTGEAEWGLLRVGGRIVGVHSLSEKQPIKQEGFDPEEAGLSHKQKYSEWAFTYPPDLMIQMEASGDVNHPGFAAKPLEQKGGIRGEK